jgi:transposase
LIELAWRVVRYQPRYGPVLRWQAVLKQRNNPGARKKAVVAIGRRLAIDIWRLETGRTTMENLQTTSLLERRAPAEPLGQLD